MRRERKHGRRENSVCVHVPCFYFLLFCFNELKIEEEKEKKRRKRKRRGKEKEKKKKRKRKRLRKRKEKRKIMRKIKNLVEGNKWDQPKRERWSG